MRENFFYLFMGKIMFFIAFSCYALIVKNDLAKVTAMIIKYIRSFYQCVMKLQKIYIEVGNMY